jgi:serine/threonine protein kinase
MVKLSRKLLPDVVSIDDVQIQDGGRVLGKGGEGCVVAPEIICSNPIKSRTHQLAKDKHKLVSKLTTKSMKSDKDIKKFKTQYLIESILKKADPNDNNFCVSYGWCRINKKDIKKRSNVVEMDYINSSDSSIYSIADSDKLKARDKDFCGIKFENKPINIIYPNCGYDLYDVMVSRMYKNKNSDIIKLYDYIKQNFKHVLYKMLLGVKKMGENKIIHYDIKEPNILVKIEENTFKCLIADFGLAIPIEHSDINKLFDYMYEHGGTNGFMSPEYLAIVIIDEYPDKSADSITSTIIKYIREENYSWYSKINIEKKLGISMKDQENRFKKYIPKLKQEIESNRYFNTYYNTSNLNGHGYLGDIFSLGITFAGLSYCFNIDMSDELKSLILGMIEYNPENRLNVYDCINSAYFNDIRNKHILKRNLHKTKKHINKKNKNSTTSKHKHKHKYKKNKK